MSRYSFRLFFMLLDILSFPIICNTYVLISAKAMALILVAKTVRHVNEKAPVADRHGRNWPCSAIATKFALSLIYLSLLHL